MQVTDGSDIQTNLLRDCDVAIVGSGPAGATVARRLAGEGADVVVVEEGPYIEPEDFPADTFTAFTEMYRDMGSQLTANFPPIPVLQGRVVGGSSVNNGAICWQFPREVYERWCEDDRELEEALPWEVLKEHETQIEEDLKVAPTADAIAGPNNTLMGEGAEELGLEHRPIRRNVDGDCGRGRCMQGCPEGKKMSMDRSYLPDAVDRGAEILSSVRVDRIDLADGRARAIEGAARGGGRVRVRADRAVVLAASAIQTPALLLRNGIDHGPVGDHLQAGASANGPRQE
ncbi:MAG: GMC family oxidoreductase N-terminal domain-containing protein, partial [Bradymonadaceae bacterium]